MCDVVSVHVLKKRCKRMKKNIILLNAFVVLCNAPSALLKAECVNPCSVIAGHMVAALHKQAPECDAAYVYAYSTTTQKVTTANVFQPLQVTTNVYLDGWKHLEAASDFICQQPGLYRVTYDASATITSGANARQLISILANLNGTEIVGSERCAALTTNNALVPLSNTFLVKVKAGDKLEFAFTGTTANTVQLIAAGYSSLKTNFNVTITQVPE